LEKTASKKLKAQHRSAAAAKQEDKLWTNSKLGTFEILLADQSQIFLSRATRISESLQRKYGRSCTKQGTKTTTNNKKRRERDGSSHGAAHVFYSCSCNVCRQCREKHMEGGGVGGSFPFSGGTSKFIDTQLSLSFSL
jgi:hypothetical protein